jgi:hypothetical protein
MNNSGNSSNSILVSMKEGVIITSRPMNEYTNTSLELGP